MKTTLALFFVAFAAACPSPAPVPQPPVPSTYRLQIYVHDDADDSPLVAARGYRDNVPAENPNMGGSPFTLGSDAGAAWQLSAQDFNVCALDAGYSLECAPVPLHANLTLTIKLKKLPTPTPPPPPVESPATWTIEQLKDLQGDLMIWAPDVGCSPEARIDCGSAHGLQAGWVWSLTTPRFSAENRQKLYADAKKFGYTHYAIDVNACEIGGGYHNIIPVTTCDGFDDAINTTLKEIVAQHLIPVCAGITQDAPVAPGVDRSLCPIVMDDWDNTHQKDCHVKTLAQTFPNALIYVEMPQGVNPQGVWSPSPDACSPSPFPVSGGDWIRNLQRQYPNFTGVLYETSGPDGVDAQVADLVSWNPWFRDLQQVVFETDTYWKFWNGWDVNAQKTMNDAIRAKAPWTLGYFSGGTSHPPVQGSQSGSGHFEGELSGDQIQVVDAVDFRQWPVTSQLTNVTIGLDGVYLTFDKQDTWPEISFGVQYSLGMCLNINSQWYCNAPIELWKGLPRSGGAIQAQDINGTGIGQIATNWWYAPRWGILQNKNPAPNEQIGIFAVAGDARNGINNPQERTNIVLVRLPPPNTAATFVK